MAQADDRLYPSHISLYIALFQIWNYRRFENPISIAREDVMHLSKIGSRTTYLKCMNDLSNWKYFEYQPSKNPFKGSIIYMFNFCTSTEHVVGQSMTKKWTSTGQVVGPYINSNKHIKHKQEHDQFLNKYDEPL